MKFLKKGIVMRDFLKGSQPLINEMHVKKKGSQWSSAHQRIETSRAKSLVREDTISDFPRGS